MCLPFWKSTIYRSSDFTIFAIAVLPSCSHKASALNKSRHGLVTVRSALPQTSMCIRSFTQRLLRQMPLFRSYPSNKQIGASPNGLAPMVPVTGIEPVRVLRRGILSPLCLPVPPHRRLEWAYLSIFFVSRQAGIQYGFSTKTGNSTQKRSSRIARRLLGS